MVKDGIADEWGWRIEGNRRKDRIRKSWDNVRYPKERVSRPKTYFFPLLFLSICMQGVFIKCLRMIFIKCLRILMMLMRWSFRFEGISLGRSLVLWDSLTYARRIFWAVKFDNIFIGNEEKMLPREVIGFRYGRCYAADAGCGFFEFSGAWNTCFILISILKRKKCGIDLIRLMWERWNRLGPHIIFKTSLTKRVFWRQSYSVGRQFVPTWR